MITALTLNPCIDHTINVAGFKYGGTNKVLKTFKDVAGKGIDSNIVIMQMGRCRWPFGCERTGKNGNRVQKYSRRRRASYKYKNIRRRDNRNERVQCVG